MVVGAVYVPIDHVDRRALVDAAVRPGGSGCCTMPFWLLAGDRRGGEVADQTDRPGGPRWPAAWVSLVRSGTLTWGTPGRHVDRDRRADRPPGSPGGGSVRVTSPAGTDGRGLVGLVPPSGRGGRGVWPAALGCLPDQRRDRHLGLPVDTTSCTAIPWPAWCPAGGLVLMTVPGGTVLEFAGRGR